MELLWIQILAVFLYLPLPTVTTLQPGGYSDGIGSAWQLPAEAGFTSNASGFNKYFGQQVAPPPCDDESTDPWVRELRDRVITHDSLAAFAAEEFGPPEGCVGTVTSEFEGRKFGYVRLIYADSVTFRVETMPPETSIVTLRVPQGFSDEAMAREVLAEYTTGLGVNIDWDSESIRTRGEVETHRFQDPEPGLNARASLIFEGGVLRAIRFSMAL